MLLTIVGIVIVIAALGGAGYGYSTYGALGIYPSGLIVVALLATLLLRSQLLHL